MCARRGTPSGVTATGDSLQGHDRQTHPAWSEAGRAGRAGRAGAGLQESIRLARLLSWQRCCNLSSDTSFKEELEKKTWRLNSARFSLKKTNDSEPDSLSSKEQNEACSAVKPSLSLFVFRNMVLFTQNALPAGGTQALKQIVTKRPEQNQHPDLSLDRSYCLFWC